MRTGLAADPIDEPALPARVQVPSLVSGAKTFDANKVLWTREKSVAEILDDLVGSARSRLCERCPERKASEERRK